MKRLQRVKPYKLNSSLILQQINEYDKEYPCIEIPFPEKGLTKAFRKEIESLLSPKT